MDREVWRAAVHGVTNTTEWLNNNNIIWHDGSLDQDVQYDILVELDSADNVRKVIDVFDVMVVDASIEAGMAKCQQRLEEIGKLTAGWLDGEGAATERSAITTAFEFIKRRPTLSPLLKLYPNNHGGILAELEQGGWDISVEFSPDGTVEMYGIETEGDDEFEPITFENLSDDFFTDFDRRIGR